MPETANTLEKIIQIDERSKRNENDLKVLKPAIEKNTKVNYAQKQIFERLDSGLNEVTSDLKSLIKYFLIGIISIIGLLGGMVIWFIQFAVTKL